MPATFSKLLECFAAAALFWAAAQAASAPSPDEAAIAVRKAEFARPSGAPPFPDDNPFSAAKVELGRALFFDPLLSRSGSHSCSSCHEPGLSWGDGRARAIGDGGERMALRSPTLLNVAWLPRLGWDGKFPDVEAVTFAAVSGPANMNLPKTTLVERLAAIPAYVHAFETAFGGGGITCERVQRALAVFERTIVSEEAPFDRWVGGDEGAIGEAEKRGFALFTGRAGCSGCHSGWNFTDASFHDIGTAKGEDLGRGRLFPSSRALRFAFKVPTLRDVARRAPYMHDGSVPTLEAVLDLYDRGGIERPSRAAAIHPLGLSERDKADLVAFLQTLTGSGPPAAAPPLPR